MSLKSEEYEEHKAIIENYKKPCSLCKHKTFPELMYSDEYGNLFCAKDCLIVSLKNDHRKLLLKASAFCLVLSNPYNATAVREAQDALHKEVLRFLGEDGWERKYQTNVDKRRSDDNDNAN